MELRYKRKMKMPLKNLPGFVGGLSGIFGGESGLTGHELSDQIKNKALQIGTPNIPYINTHLASGVARKKLNLTGKGGNIASSAINFIGSTMNAFGPVKSDEEILTDAGQTNAAGNGFTYLRQNHVNGDKEMAQLSKENTSNTLATAGTGAALGASIGSVFPGAGTIIGGAIGAIGGLFAGLFGGASRRRKMRQAIFNAQQKADRANNFNQSSAQSDYLQQRYAQEHGTTTDDDLYGYKNGKDNNMILPKYKMGKYVWTSIGKTKAPANARVSGGESMFTPGDTNNSTATVVRQGKPNADDQLANVKDETVIFGNNINPRTGIRYKDEVLPYTDALEKINNKYEKRTNSKINNLRGSFGMRSDALQQKEVNKVKEPIVQLLNQKAQEQAYDHQMQEYTKAYAHGKSGLPGFENGMPGGGWLGNAIPSGIGMIASLSQYLNAKNQSVSKPNTFIENPYEGAALQTLAGLRTNKSQIAKEIRDNERRNAYAISRAGGLSGAQRYMAMAGQAIGTNDNISKMLLAAQDKDNQYKAAYAEALYKAGAAKAQSQQQAAQHDYAEYAKAHGAREQMKQMGMRNIVDQINQYAANEYKRVNGNAMYGLYSQDLDSEQKKQLAYLDGMKAYNNYLSTVNNTQPQAITPRYDFSNMKFNLPDYSSYLKYRVR